MKVMSDTEEKVYSKLVKLADGDAAFVLDLFAGRLGERPKNESELRQRIADHNQKKHVVPG